MFIYRLTPRGTISAKHATHLGSDPALGSMLYQQYDSFETYAVAMHSTKHGRVRRGLMHRTVIPPKAGGDNLATSY